MHYKVLLDTNFIITQFQFKVDIKEQLENLLDAPFTLYIIDKTIQELQKLTSMKGKTKDYAKLALQWLIKESIEVIPTPDGYADDLFLNFTSYLLCTQDSELTNRFKDKGGRVVIIRQKKFLVFKD